jgi:hypothetical protein
MSDPLLPPGIKVGSGTTLDEYPAIRVGLEAELPGGGQVEATIVLIPRQGSTLAALLLRQADLVEAAEQARQPLLRVLR